MVFRKTDRNPRTNENGNVSVPRKYVRLVDTPSCLVLFWKKWAVNGYGAAKTAVITCWPPKSVLRRVGVRR